MRQELGLGSLAIGWTVWTLHTPFPATPPTLPLRTPGGAEPNSMALPALDMVEAAAEACLFFI